MCFSQGVKKQETKVYPADQLSIEYSMDRDTILVGDPVELTITAICPSNGVVELPTIERRKDVVILQRETSREIRDDGLASSAFHFVITSFRLGDHLLSSEPISCTVGDQMMSAAYPDITLHVQSAISADGSAILNDIKAPQKLPGRIPRWVWIVLGAALVSFGVGLAIALLWKRKDQPAPPPPSIPAHLIALRALEALKARQLLEQDLSEPFYTELSLILRNYLEGRFHLNAPDETTEEIVEELSRSPELTGAQRNMLQEFMRQADMVKFAKGHPERSSMETAYETTRSFVEETKLPDTQINHEDAKATKINKAEDASGPSHRRIEQQK